MKSLTTLSLVLAISALLVAPAAADGPNLLANPGFEDNGGSYDGWSILFGSGPNISTPATDNIFQSGAAASKIFGEFLGCPFGSFTVGGYGQSFAPTAGKIYRFSGSSFVSSVDPIQGSFPCDGARAVAKIVFFDALSGGNEIAANEFIIADVTSPLDEWVDFAVSAPAPAGALRVECLILFLQPVCETGAVFVDDMEFCERDAVASGTNLLANASFSTPGLASWSGFGNALAEADSRFVRTPAGSAKMFGTFVADSPSVLTQSVPVSPGSTVELSAYMLGACIDAIEGGNANLVLGRVEFVNDNLDVLGAVEDTFLDATNPSGKWTKKSLRADVPAGTTTANVFFLFIQPNPTEGGGAWIDDAYFGVDTGTDVPVADRGFQLAQNEPNPFNPSTQVRFRLDRGGRVALKVYDLAGRYVTTLADGDFISGAHVVSWNGQDAEGRSVASGVYRYVIETDRGSSSRSMVLLK